MTTTARTRRSPTPTRSPATTERGFHLAFEPRHPTRFFYACVGPPYFGSPPAIRPNVGPPLAGGPCYIRAIMWPARKTPRLRFGRVSTSGANFFITLCIKDRTPVLTTTTTGRTVTDSLQALHSSGDIRLLAATIMPDHVHLLFTLGSRLHVGQVMGKFKALSRDMGQAPWRWQQDGFEHRIRNIESIEDYGFYLFMNPYRARLSPLNRSWPWWFCPDPSVFRFLAALEQKSAVPAAWLGLSDQVATKITSGD